jgi:putative membrane protein
MRHGVPPPVARLRAACRGENRFLNPCQPVHNTHPDAHSTRIVEMQLTEQERAMIAANVAALEAKTGTQVVAAVVGKADSYPEAPWKAFALGAGAGALATVIWQLTVADWPAEIAQTGDVLVILGSGAFLALLTMLYLPFARLFVARTRRDVEVTQFAESLFFRRGLDRTRGRVGILLLVSLFERKVLILADEGFDGRIGADDWSTLTRRMTLLLRLGTTASALRAGLDAMVALLLERGYHATGADSELPDVLDMKDGQ